MYNIDAHEWGIILFGGVGEGWGCFRVHISIFFKNRRLKNRARGFLRLHCKCSGGKGR